MLMLIANTTPTGSLYQRIWRRSWKRFVSLSWIFVSTTATATVFFYCLACKYRIRR